MTDATWLGAVLAAARPRAVAALLRYFRDLDLAEEAFQEACLKALTVWPRNGPPRDVAAWLITVGRNAGLDTVRRLGRHQSLPTDTDIADPIDAEAAMLERIDAGDYRDDMLRLLFICCQPDLAANQQIALALRIVCGLSVRQIARAFLVSEAAMEQRITRAKARIATAAVPFSAPGPAERAERLAAVAAMIYLVFNEGYTTGVAERGARAPLCAEAIRLARLLLDLYPGEPGLMGLTGLMLLHHARAAARFDSDGNAVLLANQDRSLWNRPMIAEGQALVDKAMRHGRPDPYLLQAAIAVAHTRADRAEQTDWAEIDRLYAVLERLQPSPIVTLNRAVAAASVRGPVEALAMIEPLAAALSRYFYFHGARGAFLRDLGRTDEARDAFSRAISLANTAAEAAYIRQQLDDLDADAATPGRKP